MPTPVYLDYNATAPLKPTAKTVLLASLETVGNPSSPHAFGREARAAVEQARVGVAKAAQAEPENVIFTASATEANNLILKGLPVAAVAVSAGEHPSVLAAVPGATRLPIDENGRLRIEALAAWLAKAPQPALVALQAANNETGVVQPVIAAAALARRHGAWLHVDAVQAVGRLPAADWVGDSVSISSHKLGGPPGVGALVLRRDAPLTRQMAGGGQERRRRAGTEAVALIAAFGVTAALAAHDQGSEIGRQRIFQDRLIRGLRKLNPTVTIFGYGWQRLTNTTCFAFPGTRAETLLIALDLEGVAVSSGSACSSGKVEPSHVLSAMDVAPETAAAALRVSTGWATQTEDIDRLLAALAAHLRRVRRTA
jgi:cysteine desulfurase